MKIALINGSPKGRSSNSGLFLNILKPLIEEGNELTSYRVNSKQLNVEQFQEINEADAIVVAFPVYFDAIPSHLLRMMVELENYRKTEKSNKEIVLYALINNGFFEGQQCKTAANIVENWCKRCSFRFGMAIGHGAGEMFSYFNQVPLGKGPLKNLGRAMDQLSNAILTRNSAESLFIQPNFPRILWRLSATYFFWHRQAKQNGLKPKDLRKQPFQENQ
ncbi:multimeric flavodoxin WrbA [Paenibacillus turicensis]|uniref:Multimeric flavodoxin WrbA n=1 Tax=Paenibacillus turicensis TaxID=160487 RepID=A0ABS4FW17_9BACL|nr:NAD(P)H-dependent oxidoreductase [Paenibacillus turicensis]MBP1906772.1 multimeric flavodoxin WrbA [Paenibacillus turicensis]